MSKETEHLAEPTTKEWHEQIAGAVARGWCSEKNSRKTMDNDLIVAIVAEVETLLKTDIHPRLGCATTGELLEEIRVRIEVHGPGLEYRTIDSDQERNQE